MTTITLPRATVEQALEILEKLVVGSDYEEAVEAEQAMESFRAALAQQAELKPMSPEQRQRWEELTAMPQQAEPDAYGYASRVAVSIWQWNYKDTAPNWKPLDDLMGVLTQIDNMTSGLTRRAQQAEPVAWAFKHSDGTYHDPSVTEHSAGMVPLYPPPPKLVPLTEEEIVRIRMSMPHSVPSPDQHPYDWAVRYARAVERALEEKNRGR